jgi:hypothetical protein
MLKLTQLHKSTSAAAIPRHSAATLYDFFSFKGSSPIKKFLPIQPVRRSPGEGGILAPAYKFYIGYPFLFSAELLTTPLEVAYPRFQLFSRRRNLSAEASCEGGRRRFHRILYFKILRCFF